jgi:hypothetical protein
MWKGIANFSSNTDLTICDTGTLGVPFKSGVIPTAETAEVDTIGCVPAITGLGDVPDSTNSFWRGTFERFDGPQCSICEPAEEQLTKEVEEEG